MMHSAGSYRPYIGALGCEERDRKRQGISVAWMPSAAVLRSISFASSVCCLLTFSSTISLGIDWNIVPQIELRYRRQHTPSYLLSPVAEANNAVSGKNPAGSCYRLGLRLN